MKRQLLRFAVVIVVLTFTFPAQWTEVLGDDRKFPRKASDAQELYGVWRLEEISYGRSGSEHIDETMVIRDDNTIEHYSWDKPQRLNHYHLVKSEAVKGEARRFELQFDEREKPVSYVLQDGKLIVHEGREHKRIYLYEGKAEKRQTHLDDKFYGTWRFIESCGGISGGCREAGTNELMVISKENNTIVHKRDDTPLEIVAFEVMNSKERDVAYIVKFVKWKNVVDYIGKLTLKGNTMTTTRAGITDRVTLTYTRVE